MSSSSTARGRCAVCGTEQTVTLHDSVNVTLYPDAKRQLLHQDLTTVTCPACSAVAPVVYPLLYHDMTNRLMVQVSPTGEDPRRMPAVMKDFRFRVVRHLRQLIEKVQAWDDGLDDRAVELLKLGVWFEIGLRFEDPLTKFRAFPVDPAYLHYAGKWRFAAEGKPEADHVVFVLLIPPMEVTCHLELVVPLTSYQAAVDRLAGLTVDPAPPGTWRVVDTFWANDLFPENPLRTDVDMLVIPDLSPFPTAKSMVDRYLQFSTGPVPPTKRGFWGRWFGR